MGCGSCLPSKETKRSRRFRIDEVNGTFDFTCGFVALHSYGTNATSLTQSVSLTITIAWSNIHAWRMMVNDILVFSWSFIGMLSYPVSRILSSSLKLPVHCFVIFCRVCHVSNTQCAIARESKRILQALLYGKLFSRKKVLISGQVSRLMKN